ncbi:MAG TPA: tripartite tricarboxylate transporter substrate binding protein [Burkholderiales bacterium]
MKMHQLICAAALAAVAPLSTGADYPTKPIRLIVPFSPGGGNDIVARFVAQRLTESLGQSAVVDNRPGAGSTLGTDLVAKSAPDGYTLLITHNAIAINQTLYSKLPYDTARDFVQVIEVGTTTNTLVVNPSVPVRSVKELIALAKAKPDSLNYASTGAGGTSMLAMEYFKLETGTRIVHIPYKGTAPALTDVVAGQVQCMISALPGTIPFINSKRVVALATTGKQRSIFAKDLPTLNEAGVKGYEFDTWYGVHAPAKTPKAIIVKLNEAINKALTRDDMKSQLATQGLEAAGGTPEQFANTVRTEVQKMGRIIKASGAKPEV